MKYVRVTALILFAVLLSGCKPAAPTETAEPTPSADVQPVTESDGNLVNLPVTTTDTPVASDEPLKSREEVLQDSSVWQMRNLMSSLSSFYSWVGYPSFYPVSDDTLNSLRDAVSLASEQTDTDLVFDQYSIEPTSWGYKVLVTYPVDNWGNPYGVWFEVMPTDTAQTRIAVVSAGQDGTFGFRGQGQDYSNGGFGDDLVMFLE